MGFLATFVMFWLLSLLASSSPYPIDITTKGRWLIKMQEYSHKNSVLILDLLSTVSGPLFENGGINHKFARKIVKFTVRGAARNFAFIITLNKVC